MSTRPPRWHQFPVPQDSLADRLRTLRRRWRLIVRLSISTSVAFGVATTLLGHQQAFFAPIAAVIVIIAGAGQRSRTTLELVVGVAVGVLVGELLILSIGRGTWQIALVVALTVAISTLVGIKGLALTQAANSAVLLAAVLPVAGGGNPALTRFLDALVGGACGLAMVLLLPRNPVRDINQPVQRLLDQLADLLERTAQAMRTGDAALADIVLGQARAAQPLVDAVSATALNVEEIARMSPMRWGQRAELQRFVGSVHDLDNALRDARVLARRVSAMLRHGESAPVLMATAVEQLARAVRIYADDLASRDDFVEAREAVIEAARTAITCLSGAMTINAAAIGAQVRSLAADLLAASGVTRDEMGDLLDFG
ncbi:MAG: FUSC family protein [Aeromicrobium sp.]|uniref:FUSC family protein n=1 Tax=Aeromicrobium sp. TaxID=1871063 RepID=UPI0039E2F852